MINIAKMHSKKRAQIPLAMLNHNYTTYCQIIQLDAHVQIEFKKIKSEAYSSQGSHTGYLDFCNWLADGSTTG